MDSNFTNVTKKPLTRKQKIWFGAGILVVFLYFNPSILRSVFGMFASKPKPSPMVHAAALTPDQETAAAAAATFAEEVAQYGGRWGGRGQIPGRGTCNFGLEVKPQANTAKPFAGYANVLCVDMTIPNGTKMNAESMAILTAEKVAPSSTVLSGNVTNGSLAYQTDKVVSRDYKKCDMESLNVTPFGSGQLAVQWKDNCGGGEMTLVRR